MKIIPKNIFFVSMCAIISIAVASCENSSIKYTELHNLIKGTAFIDVHAHPALGHRAYSARDPYPTLEPLIGRPYWPIPKERVAVFDTLQPAALRDIYGYTRDDVLEEDIPVLGKLSEKFWAQGEKDAFNKILDLCGIERVFSNSEHPLVSADEERVLWVPFVDMFLYPLDPEEIRAISPGLKEAMRRYFSANGELAQEYGLEVRDLSSHIALIDRTLSDYKKNKAVALKVASAYIRTLWFDRIEEEDAAAVFKKGTDGKVKSWEEYKRLQDFLARQIFLKAAELDLPVHFHTGFGATATLRNLDSNPLNLESVFSDMTFKKTRFLMLHTGYPFGDKLKPMLEKRNAYVEFSAANWMLYEDELASILFDWLSYPGASEKIMFGSDAGSPVFFWIAAENSRRALYSALSRLIDLNKIDEDKAMLIAKKIMRDNAIRLHNLD